MELNKFVRRTVRYNGLVERLQKAMRMNSRIFLAPINLEIETKPGDILIDCGANVGDVTSSFARTGATVYAFEPDPLCFSVLSRRFAVTRSVTCYNQGVMDRECSLILNSVRAHDRWDDLDATVASSFVSNPASNVQQPQVRCMDMSDFIVSLNKRIRLLKLDIEGAEIAVINRLSDTGAVDLIDLAIVETHERQQPDLLQPTEALRARIAASGHEAKFRLDWV